MHRLRNHTGWEIHHVKFNRPIYENINSDDRERNTPNMFKCLMSAGTPAVTNLFQRPAYLLVCLPVAAVPQVFLSVLNLQSDAVMIFVGGKFTACSSNGIPWCSINSAPLHILNSWDEWLNCRQELTHIEHRRKCLICTTRLSSETTVVPFLSP